jgi:hypothetical protein
VRVARIAVLVDGMATSQFWRKGLNVFELYVQEILSHAGLPFARINSIHQLTRDAFDILIVACSRNDEDTDLRIWEFAERGGVVISYAGLSSLAGKLGCVEEGTIHTGYAWLPPIEGELEPLRFLKAVPWRVFASSGVQYMGSSGILVAGHPSGRDCGAALLHFRVGDGAIERWAVDIPTTVVGLQQGLKPVTEDGRPALDGTGSIDDGILKADDGFELDWEHDRAWTETGTPYFAHPYADLWREVLVHHLLQRVVEKGLTAPFVSYWPDGIQHVAMISHDSDANLEESAETTLRVLDECGIQSSWCILEPGYSPSIYEQVKAKGHELALHFNALDYEWTEEEFRRQFQWLLGAIGEERVTSNKNHYTRFEGFGELFRWCENCGIESDQTRGPSKKGNIGFLFGTCHPYFPIAWADERNRFYNVLEIGMLTQDLDHINLADSSVVVPFLEQVRRVQGVAHFLFHQVHIHRQPSVQEAMRKVVREARKRGFVFWTGKQINDWERIRRKVKIKGLDYNGNLLVNSSVEIDGLVVWIPLPNHREHGEGDGRTVERRFGVWCEKRVISVKPRTAGVT